MAVYNNTEDYETVEVKPPFNPVIMQDSKNKVIYVNVEDETSYQELGPLPETKPDIYTYLHTDL